ncbi:alpha/beta fold hydrolase [Blastococcus sp. SYSU D00813]
MYGVAAPERLGTTELSGGRRLGWSEWGPPDGRPVLLCPGAATSRSLGFGTDVLAGLGVRLVSADRPGLGVSDPLPGRDLVSWVDDVAGLCADRGLGRPAVVGFSAGAPFALACAAAGVVSAAAVVSGTDELADPAVRGRLVPDVAGLVDLAGADPAGAAAVFAGLASPEAMEQMVLGGSSDADRAVYAEPGFAAAYRRAMAEAFAQGPEGYTTDTVLTMRRWPFDPAAVPVPVDLWYGALDASPVHSPDAGAGLAARLPTARRTVLADAGGALLWTHAEAVLTALLERA